MRNIKLDEDEQNLWFVSKKLMLARPDFWTFSEVADLKGLLDTPVRWLKNVPLDRKITRKTGNH
jgi:hypothetical protein